MAKVQKTRGCWLWQAAVLPNGYGVFGVKNAVGWGWRYAHRQSYILFVGDIPDGLLVLHKCDNRRCVKPKHLFVGTARDNSQDMVAKKRHRHGESSTTAKLTSASVRKMRALAAKGARNKDLAKLFGVGKPQISRVVYGQRWKHIGGALRG